tara:strand:+ start:406 stop:912 length:507 start_codon:yes stop_codon:yes gene_type:complete
MESFTEIKGYEGFYELGDKGTIRSLDRNVFHYKGGVRKYKSQVIKTFQSKEGYVFVRLSKNGVRKTHSIHQLVAMTFLNHKPCGWEKVVDHIDNNKRNNSVDNLQIITNRENSSKDRSGKSKYTGVHPIPNYKKWKAVIGKNGNNINLGTFNNELEASRAYLRAKQNI